MLQSHWKKAVVEDYALRHQRSHGSRKFDDDFNGEYSGQKLLFMPQPRNLLNLISALFFAGFFVFRGAMAGYGVKIDVFKPKPYFIVQGRIFTIG